MKRIRVELDVDDEMLDKYRLAVDGERARMNTVATTMSFRSVEVVEPERWTELVLRYEGPEPFGWELDSWFHLKSECHKTAALARLVSCTEREEYPNG